MKSVLFTFSATVSTLVVAAVFFLNAIIGTFGLVATSVETMKGLQSSQQIVQKMKARLSKRKIKTSKRFVKRSVKRVGSLAMSSAVAGFGIVAVTVAMTGLEIADYCEEKLHIQEDTNILYGTNVEFDNQQCLEEGKEDTKAILREIENTSSAAVSDALNATREYSDEQWIAIKTASLGALQSSVESANDLWESTRLWFVQ